MDSRPLLSVENLVTSFYSENGKVTAVDDISFMIHQGKTLAVVGESGCGKSVTALSIMRLLPESNSSIDNGQVIFDGRNILNFTKKQVQDMRGNEISMIFQEPMTALNPVFTVGQQISEVFRIHRGYSRAKARKEAIKMLREVHIPDPHLRIDEYPFQLSGGMRQRVMIAMALACQPKILIADEPTTALDVTIQAQILSLMKGLQASLGTAIIFITHDLGVVADIADDVLIMYAGKVVEMGSVYDIFETPLHPYTKGLMESIPKLEDDRDFDLSTIKGTVPSLDNLPLGCRFNTRCPYAKDICQRSNPKLREIGAMGRKVACHLVDGGQL